MRLHIPHCDRSHHHVVKFDHTKNGFPLLRLTVRYIDVQTLPKVIAVGLEF